MKRLIFFVVALMGCFAAASSVAQSTGDADIYLNEHLGFNIEGYNYAQDELPCEIDTTLVSKILERAEERGLNMQAVSTADKIQGGEKPVLAIDIEGLALGSEEFTFGIDTDSNLPSVQVTAGLLHASEPGSAVTAGHSCAFASLTEFTPSSDVLDLGTTHTVCSATQKCLNDLSNDIVQWVAPQL